MNTKTSMKEPNKAIYIFQEEIQIQMVHQSYEAYLELVQLHFDSDVHEFYPNLPIDGFINITNKYKQFINPQ